MLTVLFNISLICQIQINPSFIQNIRSPISLSYSYSVQSISSSIVSGSLCQGTPEAKMSSISCLLNKLIYLFSQSEVKV